MKKKKGKKVKKSKILPHPLLPLSSYFFFIFLLPSPLWPVTTCASSRTAGKVPKSKYFTAVQFKYFGFHVPSMRSSMRRPRVESPQLLAPEHFFLY